MLRPTAAICCLFTALGGLAGAALGGYCQSKGSLWLLLFAILTFLGACRYTFGVWSLPKNHPIGNLVFAPILGGLGLSLIAIWLAWTSDREPVFLGKDMGRIIGLAGFAVAAPGFLRIRYQAHLRHTSRVSALAAAVRDSNLDSDIRCRAAVSLGRIGMPDAEPAVPSLVLATEDDDSGVSFCAHGALLMLGIPLDKSVDAMKRALGGGSLFGLAKMHEFGDAVVPLLLEGLAADDAGVRERCAQVLGRMEPAPRQAAIVALEQAQSDSAPRVQRAAGDALARLNQPLPIFGPALKWSLRWTAVGGVLVLIGYGCSYTPVGRMSYVSMLRDLGTAAAPAMVKALGDDSSEVRGVAREALRKLGPAAVPALLEGRACKMEGVRKESGELLGELREQSVPMFVEGLEHPDVNVRFAAMEQLARLGAQAAPAVDGLTGALRDEDRNNRIQAAKTLASIGPAVAPAVSALADGLLDADEEVRRSFAGALKAIGPAAKPAVPRLIELIATDPVPAAEALATIGPGAAPAAGALVKTLGHADPRARDRAATALGAIEVRDNAVVIALLDAQNDRDSSVRNSAAAALREVGPRHATILQALDRGEKPEETAAWFPPKGDTPVSVLLDVFHHGTPQTRLRAVQVLGRIGPAAAEAKVPLIETLRSDGDQKLRAAAAAALGSVAPSDKEALAALSRTLDDSDKGVRTASIASLGHVGEGGIPGLMKVLGHSDSDVWSEAARALARLGATAVPAVETALGHENRSLRARAAYTLSRIGPPAAKSLPALRKLLHDPYASARLYAAEAVWAIGRDDGVVPVLAGFLDSKSEYARQRSVRVLAEIGPAAKPAVAALSRAVQDPDKAIGDAIVAALGALGPVARDAVPGLLVAAKQHSRGYSLAAIATLGRIAPDDPQVFNALKAMLGDKSDDVREAALRAIACMSPKAGDVVSALIPLIAATKNPRLTADIARAIGEHAGSGRQKDLPAGASGNPQPTVSEKAAVAAIETLLKHEDARVRCAAAVAIWRIDGRVEPGLRSAADAMDKVFDPTTLAEEIAPMGAAAVPVLRDVLGTAKSAAVRRGVAAALGRIGPAAKPAVPDLCKALEDESDAVGWEAAKALGRIGPEAKDAVPSLKKAFDQWKQQPTGLSLVSFHHASYAAEALACIDPKEAAGVALDWLVGQSKRRDAVWAIRILGLIGPDAHKAVPALIEIRSAAGSRLAKLQAQRGFSPQTEEKPSTRRFEDELRTLRAEVADALQKIESRTARRPADP